jgi:hypothetical protein
LERTEFFGGLLFSSGTFPLIRSSIGVDTVVASRPGWRSCRLFLPLQTDQAPPKLVVIFFSCQAVREKFFGAP